MTVVAYKDGVMAGDTTVIGPNNLVVGYASKVFGFGNTLIGVSGKMGQAKRCVDYLSKNLEVNQSIGDIFANLPTGDFFVLIVLFDRRVFRYSGSGDPIEVQAEYHAIGSGSMAALGAMAAGSTAAEAVAITMKIDPLSGGTVLEVCFACN